MSQRTTGLTAICILAITLGGIGLITGALKVVGIVGGAALQQSMGGQPGMQPEALQIQEDMMKALQKLPSQNRALQVLLAGLHLLVASGLLAGGIMCLQLKSAGRVLLMSVCLLAIGYELVNLWPTWESLQVAQQYMPRLLAASVPKGGNQPPNMEQTMGTVGTIVTVVQYVLMFGLVAIKCMFYGIAALYLTRESIAVRFRGASVPASDDPMAWRG